jgi:hypothetical protein
MLLMSQYPEAAISSPEAVFVLHCFQKKSKAGIATPAKDMDLVRSRLKDAERINDELRRRRVLETNQDGKPSG